jgi:spermidine synthase
VRPSEVDQSTSGEPDVPREAVSRARDDAPHELERVQGRSGELALRARGGHLEVISDGSFLISTENEASSRSLVSAATPWLPDGPLHILIGGLGLGFALDEALRLPRTEAVMVAEFEPAVVSWFARYGAERARRASADSRARIVVADVQDVLRAASQAYDLIALDTDNGPHWLVRESNAALYDDRGLALVFSALKAGGVAVFWSPERYPRFEAALGARFPFVRAVAAVDVVGGRALEFTMYVAAKAGSPPGDPKLGAEDTSK